MSEVFLRWLRGFAGVCGIFVGRCCVDAGLVSIDLAMFALIRGFVWMQKKTTHSQQSTCFWLAAAL